MSRWVWVVVAVIGTACRPPDGVLPAVPGEPPLVREEPSCDFFLPGFFFDMGVLVGTNVPQQVFIGAAECPAGASLSNKGTVRAVDATGVSVPGSFEVLENRVATISFVPPHTGEYVVRVEWNDGTEGVVRRAVVAEGRTTIPFTTTFVDRMDTCVEGPFRTLDGLTVCSRELQGATVVSVYRPDGSLLQTFPGLNLIARGNSVWTSVTTTPDVVELRVASRGALTLVGSAEVGAGGLTTERETSGLRRTARGFVFATARYDGTRLSVDEEATPWPDVTGATGVVFRDQNLWWENACQVVDGCASMPLACDAVRTCAAPGFFTVMSVEEDAVWLWSGRVSMLSRPLDATARPLEFEQSAGFGAALNNTGSKRGGQRPAIIINNQEPVHGVLLPQREGATFRLDFVATPAGSVRTVTREFMVSVTADPFVLRFDPTPQ
jgi:hypothetical protein